jgi:hypothetical protein
MGENVLERLSSSPDLNYFSDGASFCVIDVPAGNFARLIAQQQRLQSAALMVAGHKLHQPLQRTSIIFRPKHLTISEFHQALMKSLRCQF